MKHGRTLDAVPDWFNDLEVSFANPVRITDLSLNPLTQSPFVSALFRDDVRNAAGEDVLESLDLFITGVESFLLIRGAFETVNLDPTPRDFPPTGQTWFPGAYAALALTTIAGLRAVSYLCENSGILISNLVAMEGEGRIPEKSRGDMRGHTDACSFPFTHEFDPSQNVSPAPDFVILWCYRNPDKTPTCVAPLSKIVRALTDADFEQLQRPLYTIGSQRTFDTNHRQLAASIITTHPQFGLQIRFSHTHATLLEPEHHPGAEEALDNLFESVKACMDEVVLDAGSILFINNRTALHGRRKVGGEIGGNSRWIQRMYAMLPNTPSAGADLNQPFMLLP